MKSIAFIEPRWVNKKCRQAILIVKYQHFFMKCTPSGFSQQNNIIFLELKKIVLKPKSKWNTLKVSCCSMTCSFLLSHRVTAICWKDTWTKQNYDFTFQKMFVIVLTFFVVHTEIIKLNCSHPIYNINVCGIISNIIHICSTSFLIYWELTI